MHPIVFHLDVDNTLPDNDRVQQDLANASSENSAAVHGTSIDRSSQSYELNSATRTLLELSEDASVP